MIPIAAAILVGAGLLAGTTPDRSVPRQTCSGWSGAGTIVETGTSQDGGLRGRFRQRLDVRDGRYSAGRDYGLYKTAEGFDGNTAWSSDRSGGSHPLDAQPAKAIANTEAWLRRRGWCNDVRPMQRLADETHAGVALSVWRLDLPDGTPALVRFDRATGLLRETEIRLWGSRLIQRYDRWRRVDGVLMPFREVDDYPEDEARETIVLASVSIRHAAAGQSAYGRPAPPRDHAILGGGQSSTVPYEDDGIGRIFVPVLVDGKGPFAFELDTGGHLILTSAAAARLGLTGAGSFNGTGGGTGIVKQSITRLREIRIGDAVMSDQPVKIVPLSDASNDRGKRLPRAGILGLELFERFAVELDRRSKTMTLTSLERFPGARRGTALPIRFIEDAPLAHGSFDGIAGLFELDSGDSGPAIVEDHWARQHGLVERLSRGLDWTGGGVGGEYREILSRGDFTLGPVRLRHEIVSYVGPAERGSESTWLQAGVIGESSLYRFNTTYDYARQLVSLEPVEGIAPLPFNRSGLRLGKQADGGLSVNVVVPGSPASRAGFTAGDRIVAIDGRPASGLSATDAFLLLSRPAGSTVTIESVPKDGGGERTVTIQLAELLP